MAYIVMIMKLLLLTCLLAITGFASAGKVTNPKHVPRNAILLSKVESLTFRAGRKTTSRRVAPVEQLSCAGPSGVCALYSIDTIRCTNEGADYDAENIQWACRADLPEEFKLGSTEVACEGYASSDDPYILKGSCGVEYRLLLTDKGEERFGSHLGDSERGEASNAAMAIFFLIFFGVLFIIIKGMVDSCRRRPVRQGGGPDRPSWFSGGGGGGGDGDDGTDDPPPPYDSHGFNSRRGKGTNYGTAGPSRSGQQQQGWRPGPWTAGLAGASLGYALGRNNNQRRTENTGGGWFNQGNGSGTSSRSSSSRSSAPSFSSSSRHESTGFGSTSRR